VPFDVKVLLGRVVEFFEGDDDGEEEDEADEP